jgi:hypothetical protein
MGDKLQAAREAFLTLIADAEQWGIDYEADQSPDTARMIDCSTYNIRGPISGLRDLCEALDIKPKYMQSLEDAIQAAVNEDPKPE